MSNYGSVEKRKVKGIAKLNGDGTAKRLKVGQEHVVSIYTIDIKEKVYLVNYESGESQMFYDVSNVMFYK